MIIYQLFLRAFTREGTLREAEKHLPSLAELGVDAVYLCPIVEADGDERMEFRSPRQIASGTGNPKNPYRIGDYFRIDPEYGTEEELASFVGTAHALGLRVMLDLVYYHCGPSSTLAKEHPEYLLPNGEWCFPRLNFDSAALREYLWDNMTYFIKKYDIDGYRCDVGDGVPLDFWAEGIRRCKALRPDFIMLNEGGKPEYLSEFDINYHMPGDFMGSILWNMLRGSGVPGVKEHNKTAASLTNALRIAEEKTPAEKLMLRAFDNHDVTNDALKNLGGRIEKVCLPGAVGAGFVLCFAAVGAPFIYNGYEYCDTNMHSIFANRTYGGDLYGIDRSKKDSAEGKERFAFLQGLCALHHTCPALCSGEETLLENSAPDDLVTLLRTKNSERVLAVISFSDKDCIADIDLPADGMTVLLSKNMSVKAENGRVAVTAGAFGYALVKLQ